MTNSVKWLKNNNDPFYAHDKLVEHWDATEAIVPRTQWKNGNGKF